MHGAVRITIHKLKASIASLAQARISLHSASSWIRSKAVAGELKSKISFSRQELTIVMHYIDVLRIHMDELRRVICRICTTYAFKCCQSDRMAASAMMSAETGCVQYSRPCADRVSLHSPDR